MYACFGIISIMRLAKKDVFWIGSSRRDIRSLGEDICDAFGTDLLSVQYGIDPKSVKHLSGGLAEIKLHENESTYRLMYVAKFEEAIYVLHTFKKKSTKGDQTPKRDAEIIKMRLSEAVELHRLFLDTQKGENK
jgi:phage-related protein